MPFGGMVDRGPECVAHKAHISLHKLMGIVDQWERRRGEKLPKVREELLWDLSRVKPYCARFCWTASRILLRLPPQVRFTSSPFWEVFGLVAGHAVRASDPDRAWIILKYCLNEFSKADNWTKRSYVAKAIPDISRSRVLLDQRIELVLDSFRIWCAQAVGVLDGIPEPVGNTIKWLFDAWAGIARECSLWRELLRANASMSEDRRRLLKRRIPDLTLVIVQKAFPLFQIYDRVRELGCADTVDCWPYWCQTIESVLPKPDWSPDEVRLVATPDMRAQTEFLLDSIRPLVSKWNDPEKKYYAELEIARLEQSLAVML